MNPKSKNGKKKKKKKKFNPKTLKKFIKENQNSLAYEA